MKTLFIFISSLIVIIVVFGFWFLVFDREPIMEQSQKLEFLSPKEISFLGATGFLDKGLPRKEKTKISRFDLKSPNLIEQKIDSLEESFEVLAVKLDLDQSNYQLAFKLENKTGKEKEFYLIPISDENQLTFQGIEGTAPIIDKPLTEIFDIEKHKKELRPELAEAYQKIEEENYSAKPIKIVLEPKSFLLANSKWQITRGLPSLSLRPVYLLVYGSAGGVKDDLIILNVHSHPQQGENWEVEFTTRGMADLRIIPNDQATINDDEFRGLYCGPEKRTPQILENDVVYYPNWQCIGTAKIIHYTKKAGKHSLKFEFGGESAFAYNNPKAKQIIFAGGSNDLLSNSATEYHPPHGDQTWGGYEPNLRSIITTPGTFQNLLVKLQAAPGAGTSYQFSLVINGTATALTVTISNIATSGADTSNTVSVSANDKISIRSVPSGTPATTYASWTMEFVPTNDNESNFLGGYRSQDLSTSDARYGVLVGTDLPVATIENSNQVIPQAGTIKNLYVELNGSPGTGKNYTFTVMKNNVVTSLTVTIADTATSGNDTSNSVSVVAGDLVSLGIVPNNGPTARRAIWGTTFDNGGSGTSPTLNHVAAPTSLTVATYGLIEGKAGAVGGESSRQQLGQSVVLKNMYANVSVAPGSGKSWTITLRQNGSNSSVTATISGTNTQASDTVNTLAVANNDLLSIGFVPSGTPASAQITVGFEMEEVVTAEAVRIKGGLKVKGGLKIQF